MGASVGRQPQWQVPPPTINSAAPAGRRLGRRLLGMLGLAVALLWDFVLFAGMAWLTDSSTGIEFLERIGGFAGLQFATLVLGFVLCLAGGKNALRWATVCAAVVFVLVLAIGVIGALSADSEYWLFGVLFGLPDILLVAGIAAMSWRTPTTVS
jgi:hypothetical protein